jgi:hypothetical protein
LHVLNIVCLVLVWFFTLAYASTRSERRLDRRTICICYMIYVCLSEIKSCDLCMCVLLSKFVSVVIPCMSHWH